MSASWYQAGQDRHCPPVSCQPAMMKGLTKARGKQLTERDVIEGSRQNRGKHT